MQSEIFSLLVRASLTLSIAVLIVLCLRGLVRRVFGARIAYALWATVPLAVLAALLPRPRLDAVPVLTNGPHAALGTLVSDLAAAPTASITSTWLLCAWLAGALVTLVVVWRTQARFMARLGTLVARSDGTWQAHSDRTGPALVGALAPRIIVPGDFEQRYSARERELILAHERIHRRHGDAQINAAIAALRCLQWFNPLVHFAAGRFRVDQELACDATVLREFPQAQRAYADAMLKTQLIDSGLPIGCHWQSSHPLVTRISMIRKPAPGRTRRLLGAATVVTTLVAASCIAWAAQSVQIAPSYARLSPPTYPADVSGIVPEGTVFLKVRVGRDGQPISVERERVVPESLPAQVADQLFASADAAVRTWTFNSAQRDGKSEEGSVIVPVTFSASAVGSPVSALPESSETMLDEIAVRRQ